MYEHDPNAFALDGADLPPYLVRWLDLDHEARARITTIFDTLPVNAANVTVVREFGLNFGGVSLVRKILRRHSGRTRGKVTQAKADAIIRAFHEATSPRGQIANLQAADGLDAYGYVSPMPLSKVMSAIGASVGLSRTTVARVLADYGIWETRQRRLVAKLDPNTELEIVLLSSEETGLTLQEIADQLNLHRSTVSRVLRKNKIIRESPPIGSTDAGISRPRGIFDAPGGE